MLIPNQDLKQCSKCKQFKPPSEFYQRAQIKGTGLNAQCSECVRAKQRAYFDKKGETLKIKQNAVAKKRRQFLKDAAFSAYGGYVCVCCAETEVLFLTLDHINNDGAEFRRKLMGTQARGGGYRTYLWAFHNNYPLGLQVMCANCQHGKRMNKGVCPHQVRRNDHSQVEVGSSEPKRSTPLVGDDMICSVPKGTAVTDLFSNTRPATFKGTPVRWVKLDDDLRIRQGVRTRPV